MSLYERQPHFSPNQNNQVQVLKYIQIDPPISYLHAGKSLRLRVKAVYSDGIEKDVTPMVHWGIPTTEVGSISGNGTVHVLGLGSMMVTAEYEGQRAESVIVSVADHEKSKQDQNRRRKQVTAVLALCFLVIIGGILLFNGFSDDAASESGVQQESPGMSVTLEEELPVPAQEPAKQTKTEQITPEQKTQSASVPLPANSIISETSTNDPPVQSQTVTSQGNQQKIEQDSKPVAIAVTKPATKPEAKTISKPVAKPAIKPAKPVTNLTKPETKTVTKPNIQPTSKQSISYIPVVKDGKWGYMMQTGAFDKSLAIPYQFDHATRFTEGLALVKKDGKFGYINTAGTVVIPIQYEYATPFQNGMATVMYQRELSKINTSGQLQK